MLGMQGKVLDAAVAAGVPRFIPSDYSLDFTKTRPGENRNLDLRRRFRETNRRPADQGHLGAQRRLRRPSRRRGADRPGGTGELRLPLSPNHEPPNVLMTVES